MNKNRIFTIFFLIISTSIFGQNIKYARKVIDTLCSPYMGGRGYVDDGMHRAADFINQEFETIQLKKFTKEYTQNFDIHVNTFPSEMLVNIDGKELVPGIDFLVSSSSTGIKGEFGVEWLNPAWIKDENKIKEFARKDFNAAIAAYNKSVRGFPVSMVAGLMGFHTMEGFQADTGTDRSIEIKF